MIAMSIRLSLGIAGQLMKVLACPTSLASARIDWLEAVSSGPQTTRLAG